MNEYAWIGQVSKVMEKFEEQFTDLDVRTSVCTHYIYSLVIHNIRKVRKYNKVYVDLYSASMRKRL